LIDAAHDDAIAANPVASWRDLWAEGFLAMAICQEHGGLGLDMSAYIGGIETLAKGCANTTMTMHTHSTIMHWFIAALRKFAHQTRYFVNTVHRGKMFGSWSSEPSVSLSRTRPPFSGMWLR
jgi:alkylation response protein AidB-like acyl-CoA dehydrogenase